MDEQSTGGGEIIDAEGPDGDEEPRRSDTRQTRFDRTDGPSAETGDGPDERSHPPVGDGDEQGGEDRGADDATDLTGASTGDEAGVAPGDAAGERSDAEARTPADEGAGAPVDDEAGTPADDEPMMGPDASHHPDDDAEVLEATESNEQSRATAGEPVDPSAHAPASDSQESSSDPGPSLDPTEPPSNDEPAPEDIEYYCPECEYVDDSRWPSRRAGDVCPDCRRSYLSQRQQ